MTTSPLATTSLTDLYVRVQQFYAGQVHHLDGMRADEFAATFTEDCLFDHGPGRPPLAGRREIADQMREYPRTRYADDPCQRRHWFNMLRVFAAPDGTARTEYYALVMLTRPGVARPELVTSCFVRDVLVLDGPDILVQERIVRPDHLP